MHYMGSSTKGNDRMESHEISLNFIVPARIKECSGRRPELIIAVSDIVCQYGLRWRDILQYRPTQSTLEALACPPCLSDCIQLSK